MQPDRQLRGQTQSVASFRKGIIKTKKQNNTYLTRAQRIAWLAAAALARLRDAHHSPPSCAI